jgi:hypothetical protein
LDYQVSQVGLSEQVKGVQLHIVDYRDAEHPLYNLKELIAKEEVAIWAESEAKDRLSAQGIIAYSRFDLPLARRLAIWTPPASPGILTVVLQSVQPEIVYLFNTTVETDQLAYFLSRLTGLVKYRLASSQGRLELDLLAAAIAQPEILVTKGLAWLAARGHITVCASDQGLFDITNGGVVEPTRAESLIYELENLLVESRAYHAYYARADIASLFPDANL